jgi:hypothetical protein
MSESGDFRATGMRFLEPPVGAADDKLVAGQYIKGSFAFAWLTWLEIYVAKYGVCLPFVVKIASGIYMIPVAIGHDY